MCLRIGMPKTINLRVRKIVNSDIMFAEKGNGEACSSSVECLVSSSICDRGQCGCPDNTYLQGMSCLNSKLDSNYHTP